MKSNKTKGVLGVAFALVLVVSLLVFALPTAAGPYDDLVPKSNVWSYYDPTPGLPGGWFFDPDITVVGPTAKDVDDTVIYAYVGGTSATDDNPGTDDIFVSKDGGRTWSVSTIPFYYTGGPVVDMVVSEVNADIVYLTDGDYVYKSVNGALEFKRLAEESLESVLMGECGMPITHLPITCIDVGYDSSGQAIVFIGTRFAWHVFPGDHATYPLDLIVGSVYYIEDGAFASDWTDLQLKCYGCCDPTTCGVTTQTAYDTGYNILLGGTTVSGWLNNHVIVPDTVLIYDDSTYEHFTDNGDGTLTGDNGGSGTIDYATGYFTLTFGVASATQQNIMATYDYSDIDLGPSLCSCGCFDVYAVGCAPDFDTSSKIYALITTDEYDCDDTVDADGYGGQHFGDPSTRVVSTTGTICNWSTVAELYWDCDDVTPKNFSVNHASRFAFPTDYVDTGAMFIGTASSTYDSSAGCLVGGDVYRVDDTFPPSDALDLNVRGFTSGCNGLRHANICSLDIDGDTDNCSLVAGAWDSNDLQIPTEVYYSTDGGWIWDDSDKDPTGQARVYVLWYTQSPAVVLAGTSGCDCAFSRSCSEEAGKYFNQISLVNMDIDQVLDLSFAPTYVTGSQTMYALTRELDACGSYDIHSLLRWDGTYWERVHSSYFYAVVGGSGSFYSTPLYEWVEVSPDYLDTFCLYMANSSFDMTRSLDEGCSWRELNYPCTATYISAWIVVDEETVLASGCGADVGTIFKTTRHGSGPWDEITIKDSLGDPACCGVDFDLSVPRSAESDVLLGDACGQVYFSDDLGETWNEIEDFMSHDFGLSFNTYVVFDPGYGTAGDPGENTIYAAAGSRIGRCVLDADALWSKQDWLYLSDGPQSACDPFDLCLATGIDAAGDTVLYVSDAGVGESTSRSVMVDGTIEVNCKVFESETCTCCHDLLITGEVVTEVGTVEFENDEPVTVDSWDLTCMRICIDEEGDEYCACVISGQIWLRGSISGAYGYIDVFDIHEITDTGCGCTCTPVQAEVIGGGNGSQTYYYGTLLYYPLCCYYDFEITDSNGQYVYDTDCDGVLEGDGTGTIDYITGDYAVTFDDAPPDTAPITVDYSYDNFGDGSPICFGLDNATVISSFLQADVTAASDDCPCGAGVWRTVDALAPIDEIKGTNKTEFEFLDAGLLSNTALFHPNADGWAIYPDDLWLTEGSNVLWVLDYYNPTYIWTWDDPLATQVILVSPSNGAAIVTPTVVTLEWDALDNATNYEVMLYSFCPSCPDQMLPVSGFPYTTTELEGTCLSVTGLTAGTTYYWKVRVACDSPQVSKWSDIWSFSTALDTVVKLCSPACGASDIILTTNFTWDEVLGATSYEIQVVAASSDGTVDWTGATALTSDVNAIASIPGLAYSTTYYWRVRAVGPDNTSDWSVCLFTTMDEPVTPVEETYELVQTTEEITPTWIWVIIGIGGALTIAVIILIVTTRRVP